MPLKDNVGSISLSIYYLIFTTICYMMQDKGDRGRGSVRALANTWERCPFDVSMLIHYMGFGPFLDSLVGAPQRRSLIILSALAQYWWDTTNTFHFSFGEMTMTPLNFHTLGGLPFEGSPSLLIGSV